MEVVAKLQGYAKTGSFTAAMAGRYPVDGSAPTRSDAGQAFRSFPAGLFLSRARPRELTNALSEILAELVIGCDYFLRFAESIGAITHEDRAAHLKTVTDGLLSLVDDQVNEQAGADDCGRFMQIIRDLLAIGEAYIEDEEGKASGRVWRRSCGWS